MDRFMCGLVRAGGLLLCGLVATGCQKAAVVERVESGPAFLPTYVSRYTAEAPVIDGRLDDAAWQLAAPAELRLTDTGRPPRQPTTMRALWSDKNLYIAFDCADDDIWGNLSEHDANIYEQEVVEVFINENGDGKAYLELEVSPNNTVLDMYILNPGGGRAFKGMKDYECEGLKTAVVVDGKLSDAPGKGPKDDKRWTVEIAIPFDQLPLARNTPPAAGDRMRWNLYRIDRPGGDGKQDEYCAFSPTIKINYHTPERFGWVEFVK